MKKISPARRLLPCCCRSLPPVATTTMTTSRRQPPVTGRRSPPSGRHRRAMAAAPPTAVRRHRGPGAADVRTAVAATDVRGEVDPEEVADGASATSTGLCERIGRLEKLDLQTDEGPRRHRPRSSTSPTRSGRLRRGLLEEPDFRHLGRGVDAVGDGVQPLRRRADVPYRRPDCYPIPRPPWSGRR